MKYKNRKFFGFTTHTLLGRKKYGYPLDVRTKKEIKESDNKKLLKLELDETLCK